MKNLAYKKKEADLWLILLGAITSWDTSRNATYHAWRPSETSLEIRTVGKPFTFSSAIIFRSAWREEIQNKYIFIWKTLENMIATTKTYFVMSNEELLIVYKYWVALASWNGTVQILPCNNILPIPQIKATQYLFYITDI